MMGSRLLGWLSLVLGGIAIAAALTAISFGGDLANYISAPNCVNGQHSISTECREVYQTAVASTKAGSPCTVTFTNASVANMDCDSFWSGLRPGSLATLELWHGAVVGVVTQDGISRTQDYPQDTGRFFIALAIALGIIAIVFAAIFYKLRQVARLTTRKI